MQLHKLQRAHSRKRKKTIGRGGKRGTTSGRGTKGQSARAGHRIRPEIRDTIKRLPKRRGYRFTSRRRPAQVVSLAKLRQHFAEGGVVSPETLMAKGLIRNALWPVKILAGEKGAAVKFTIKNCTMSTSVKAVLTPPSAGRAK